MAAWRVALGSWTGQQDPLCTQQIGGLTGVKGRVPAYPTSSNQPLFAKEAARCSNLARNPVRPRKCPGGEGSPSEGRGQEQELLWGRFYPDPALGWDKEQHKQSSRSPDFRRKGSHEVLWLENCYNPAWVDELLLNMKMGRRAPTSNSSLQDKPDSGRFVNYEMSVPAVNVSTICQQGKLTEAVAGLEVLVQTDCPISRSLFYTVLKQCVAEKDLDSGRRVHALTAKRGYESDTFLCNHILRMYASHARLQDAMDVFSLVAKPDAFMWSSIISAHVKHGQAKQAIQLYHQMRSSSVKPDGHVYVAALQACARGADLETGQQVHADVLASGVEPDFFVVNCMVDMYAKCGSLKDAQRLFDGLGQKNVVTWNAMISAYAQQGLGQEALHLYSVMQETGITVPDSVTFVCLLQACASVGTSALNTGKQLHAHIEEQGFQGDVVVGGSLVNMYVKCGTLEDARRVFDRLGQKTVVTWTALIAGYCQQGMGKEALHLYGAMQEEGISAPNSVTLVCLLHACASVGTLALENGKQLHAQIREWGLQIDEVVGGSLVNMYAKCGSLDDAQSVFDRLGQKNVVTWNSMIAGFSQKGMGKEALHLYNAMQEEGIAAPDSVTFVCLLQACASVGTPALEKGKKLDTEIKERGLEADVVIGGSLVNMYAKCGSLEDAQRVFDSIGQKTAVTWTAIIAGYSQQGMCKDALHLYSAMQAEGISSPDSVTFVCLLQACASVGTPALEKGKQLHGQIDEKGLEADVVVGGSLVNMYAKCGSLDDAQSIFDRLRQKDVVTWTAMIAGYSQQGMGMKALELYSAMQKDCIPPNSVTFVCLLQACASVGAPALEKGKQLHVQIEERGLQPDVTVGGSLVNMYAKCGSLEDAQRVFDRLPQKNVVTWTAMIAGYSQQGMGKEALHLYGAMQEEGITAPDSVTFVCLLQACASVGTPALGKGKQLDAQIQERGLQADVVLGGSLVNMYAKCGSLEDAQRVFDRLHQKDVVTWTAMIAGICQQGMGKEALHLYSAMEEEGITAPDFVTFVCLLQACASVGNLALETGKQLHAQIEERGFPGDMVLAIGSSLVNMYAKCGSLEDARGVFDRLCQKDVVTWTAMIAGYSQQGMGQEALHLYSALQREGIGALDSVTFVCLLQACATVGALHSGRQLHAQIEEQGLQADVVVANSLINMYAKCGSWEDAQSVFDRLPQKDVVTWNVMVAGYSQQGMGQEALHLYSAMQEGITSPDSVTFVCLLQACASVAALQQGRQLHAQIEEQGLQADLLVSKSLINMYAKCGSMVAALEVFDALPQRDIVAWNALIAGYARQGDIEVVFDLVQRMREDCIQLDDITFLSVLTVCSHGGLVDKGRKYFEAMSRQYGITPTIEHYTCMVDLLGRAGQVDEALEMVKAMPVKPTHVVWHALLGACQKWSNVEVGRHAFDEAVKLDETDTAAYVMMCNIYTGAQMWEETKEMQARRKKIGAWKQLGQSWWTDMNGVVHAFLVGDAEDPESEGMYAHSQNEERRVCATSRHVIMGRV